MNKRKLIIKQMSEAAIMTALYVVVSLFVNIPIINRLTLDLGYVVLGFCACFFNCWQLMAIGGIGCILKALLAGGNFPIAWFPSQLLLAFLLTYCKKIEKLYIRILFAFVATFISIGLFKTIIEVLLFHYPWWAKLSSNCVATLIDDACLCIGLIIADKRFFKKTKQM